jgi:hypothetical protein
MPEIIPQHFSFTLEFLNDLIISQKDISNEKSILSDLISHLKMDGHHLHNYHQQTFLRRRLGEISGSSLYMDIFLIFFCVLCAGLASGLTQVSLTRCINGLTKRFSYRFPSLGFTIVGFHGNEN